MKKRTIRNHLQDVLTRMIHSLREGALAWPPRFNVPRSCLRSDKHWRNKTGRSKDFPWMSISLFMPRIPSSIILSWYSKKRRRVFQHEKEMSTSNKVLRQTIHLRGKVSSESGTLRQQSFLSMQRFSQCRRELKCQTMVGSVLYSLSAQFATRNKRQIHHSNISDESASAIIAANCAGKRSRGGSTHRLATFT